MADPAVNLASTGAASSGKRTYIHLPLKEALRLKFEDGKKSHRDSEVFDGNPLEELFQECLDGMNYCNEIKVQFGLDYSHRRSTLWATALEAQTDYRRLHAKDLQKQP